MNWILRATIFLLFILVFALSFNSISYHNIQEWDEARNGVNAFEMLHNGDYINYFYDGELDTWNAKPPLMIWLIVGSYKVFGFNEFALRLPALIAAILFLFVNLKIVQLFEDERVALISSLILVSSKAILSNHLGLSADFDSLLILLLAASVYHFLNYFEKQKTSSIYLFGIFTALAFYTKGTAAFIFLPSMFIYLILTKKIVFAIKNKDVWRSFLLCALVISSWVLLVFKFGKTSNQSHYGSANSIETMFVHDTFKRFSDSGFGQIHEKNYAFFFEVLDSRMNLWNYIFYAVVLIGTYILFKNRKSIIDSLNDKKNRLILFSICAVLPLSLFLTFATSKHSWYLAPIFMFVAYITAKGIVFLSRKHFTMQLMFAGLFTFTAIRQILFILNQPSDIHKTLTQNQTLKNQTVYVNESVSQDLLLYFHWLNCKTQYLENREESNSSKMLVLTKKDGFNKLENPILEFKEYYLVER